MIGSIHRFSQTEILLIWHMLHFVAGPFTISFEDDLHSGLMHPID